MDDYTTHIQDPANRSKALCGEDAACEFMFGSIDHAYANARNYGRLLTCQACADKIIKTFKEQSL